MRPAWFRDPGDQVFVNAMWLVLGRPEPMRGRSAHRHRKAGRA